MSSSEQVSIVLLCDDPGDTELIERYFEETNLEGEINWTNDWNFFLEYLESSSPDVVLVGYNQKDRTGFDFISEFQARDLSFPLILLSQRAKEEIASEAFRLGFDDYRPISELSSSTLEQSIHHAIQKHQKEKKLEKLARTDQLTGLLNRHAIFERLKGELKRSSRNNSVSSIILFDVDNFKRINDRYGHVAGDEVLEKITSITQQIIRESDFAGRYGGDELLIVSPNTDLQGAWKLGQRILSRINEVQLPVPDRGDAEESTVSMGCACADFNGTNQKRVEQEDVVQLIDRADSALYLAKSKGGDTVERRKSERISLGKVFTEITFDGKTYQVEIFDYSKSGMGVKVQNHIPGKIPVKIHFDKTQLTNVNKEVPGKVAWVRKKEENGTFLAGINMEESPSLQIESLREKVGS